MTLIFFTSEGVSGPLALNNRDLTTGADTVRSFAIILVDRLFFVEE